MDTAPITFAAECSKVAAMDLYLTLSRFSLSPSRSRPAVAQAWEEGRRNPMIAAEIDRFETAAGRRLGTEGFRDALRGVRDGTPFAVPGTNAEQRGALQQLARGLAAA